MELVNRTVKGAPDWKRPMPLMSQPPMMALTAPAYYLQLYLAAYGLSRVLPLPGSWALSAAVTVCGLPAAGAIAFMSADFDVVGLARSAARWRRRPKRFAGCGQAPTPHGPAAAAPRPAGVGFDAESLWD